MPTMLLNAHCYAYSRLQILRRYSMADLYDIAASKKATLEQALSDKLKTIETEKWKTDNLC